MNSILRQSAAAIVGMALAMQAGATLQSSTATVTNLRIEAGYGFIGVAQDLPNCGGRVWLDMSTVLGRAMYSTAMLAFSSGKTVTVRAFDESQRVFGACNIYDIWVVQ